MQRHPSQTTEGPATDRQASVLLAKDPKELEAAYDRWAALYDEDLITLSGSSEGINVVGIAASKVLLRHFAEEIKNNANELNILDFGCGTGPASEFLANHGIDTSTQMDGCDLSHGMLEQAKKRNRYRQLIKADFESSNCDSHKYDFVLASGVFAPGQAPPSAFDEFLRVLKSGTGHAIFTIRCGYYDCEEGASHRQYLEQLIKEKKWEMIAKTEEDYLPKDGINAYVFVMKSCKSE